MLPTALSIKSDLPRLSDLFHSVFIRNNFLIALQLWQLYGFWCKTAPRVRCRGVIIQEKAVILTPGNSTSPAAHYAFKSGLKLKMCACLDGRTCNLN